MKNRQDEIKCYSTLLEFSAEKARRHFLETYPSREPQEIDSLVEREAEVEQAYGEHLERNRGLRDKVLIVVLSALNVIILVANLVLDEHSPSEIGLRSLNLLFLALLFLLSGMIHSHSFVAWVFVGVFTYLLAVEKVDEMSAANPISRSFSHYFTMMIFTVFSAISGMRFLHSLVMGSVTLVFGFVSAGVVGAVEMGSVYEWCYVALVLLRKFVFQKESIINFKQGQKTAQISKELSKIVSELLPKHAYEKLKTQNFENRLELTDVFEQCTILFADIKGFTEFSDKPENREEPQNVVRMLRSLFEEFDLLCT